MDIKDNTGEYLICYLVIYLMKFITIIDYLIPFMNKWLRNAPVSIYNLKIKESCSFMSAFTIKTRNIPHVAINPLYFTPVGPNR